MFRNKEFKLLAAISVAVILVEAFLILNQVQEVLLRQLLHDGVDAARLV